MDPPEKPSVKEESFPVISEYVKSLDEHVKRRYLQKISVIGVDPADLNAGVNLDIECLPSIQSTAFFTYCWCWEQVFIQKNNLRTLKAWRLTNGWRLVLLLVYKDVLLQKSLLC